MLQPHSHNAAPITRAADGTIKQISPFTGTEVWTVPGRAHRPLGISAPNPSPLSRDDDGKHCAFCQGRYLETPPEKSRLVRKDTSGSAAPAPRRRRYAKGPMDSVVAGSDHIFMRNVRADELSDTVAEFRRVPNLFEILSFNYWRANYGYELPERLAKVRDRYVANAAGRDHVRSLLAVRAASGGFTGEETAGDEGDQIREGATAFFGGGHNVVVARRHFVDGAEDDAQLASSGTLSPGEHRRYMAFTVEAMRSLYENNRYVRYVAAFQNWLKPAGASFDHLHKQLVAIDERGTQAEMELERLRRNPNMFNDAAVNYAMYHNLVIAENEHAIAFAGFGHRYPTIEIYSCSARSQPWDHSAAELDDMSDMVHAMHAATGTEVPSNEEWHHRPPDVDLPMPWRIMLKWRVSTLAGFEGGTKIYLNTIDPWTLRDRVVSALYQCRDEGRVADGIRIATETHARPNPLKYNPLVRD